MVSSHKADIFNPLILEAKHGRNELILGKDKTKALLGDFGVLAKEAAQGTACEENIPCPLTARYDRFFVVVGGCPGNKIGGGDPTDAQSGLAVHAALPRTKMARKRD